MDAKTTSWVSYLTLIGWIVAIATSSNMNPKPSLVTFHLRQSLGIMVTGFVLYIAFWILFFAVGFIPLLYPILGLAMFILWLLGFISALNGEEKPVPVLGESFQKWFSFIK